MNKLFVLLSISLIFSYAFCDDCDCGEFNKAGENSDHYSCVPTGDNTCDWKLLCEYAEAPASGETLECSNYPVSDKNKFKCEKDLSEEPPSPCKEVIYSCSAVPKPLTGSVECSEFPVSSENFHCTANPNEESEFACKEKPFCNYVTSSEEEQDCSKYLVKVENKVCVFKEGDATNPCQEKYLCEKVPRTETEECANFIVSEEHKYTHQCVALAEGGYACKEEVYKCKDVPAITVETDIKCSDFEVDDDKKSTHICIEAAAPSEKQCKEEYLCSSVPRPSEGQRNCGDYQVSEPNKYTHECKPIEDTTSEKACFESKFQCKFVPKPSDGTIITCSDFEDEDHVCLEDRTESVYACKEQKKCSKVDEADLATESDCSTYPVSDNSKYICRLHSGGTKCEQIYKCDQAPKNDEGDCSSFYISDTDHICIEDSDSNDKKCKEISLCNKVTKEGSEEVDCSIYPTTSNQKLCVESKETGKVCEEIYECGNVPKGEASDCTLYPVSKNRVNTHTCKPLTNSNEKDCFEEEIICSTAEKGETEEQCSKYKVSDSAKYKCIKNPDTRATSSPCVEKEMSPCELKTSGASDEICNGLVVEKEGEQKCVKEGDKCVQLTYCKYGIGNSDDDCSVFALENKEKECKKKKDENKCEEVEKKEETSATDGDDTKKSDEEKTEKSDEEKTEKSDETKVVDSTIGKENNSDGVEENKDTTKEEKGNKGYYLKGELSLLLLIALL